MHAVIRPLALFILPGTLVLTALASCNTDDELKELEEISASSSTGPRKERFSKLEPSMFRRITEKGGSSFYTEYPAGQRPNRTLKEGTQVTLVKERGTYSVVKLASGQEGFLRRKYLETVYIDKSSDENSESESDFGTSDSNVPGEAGDGSTLEMDLEDLPMDPSTYPSTPNTSLGKPAKPVGKPESDDPLSESIKRLYKIHGKDGAE